MSADGSTLAVGAMGEDSAATGIDGDQANNFAVNAGAVYVFTRTGTGWVQQAYVKASNTGSGDYFGYSVALSADGVTLAVGAAGEASAATGVGGDQANNSALGTARSTCSRAATQRGPSRHTSRGPLLAWAEASASVLRCRTMARPWPWGPAVSVRPTAVVPGASVEQVDRAGAPGGVVGLVAVDADGRAVLRAGAHGQGRAVE